MYSNRDNNDKLWYKDGVIYQVHVKAYKDSNNDGMGDLRGVIEKLDYIKSLGVNIIWLLPFYPSPLKDDGYDIADYFNINPDYGTIEDFKILLKEAHRRKIRVVTELVLNHTSDQHEWFQRARKSLPGSPAREFYVWNDTPDKYNDARIIFSDFESSNWSWDSKAKAYYWHRFYSHQPDLNFENPQVHKSLLRVIDYWFDLGVDGLRLDAVPYLYEREGTSCENLPETHLFLKKIRKYIEEKYSDKMLLAEANQWPEDAVAYFGNGDECQMAFHFPLMPRIYMATQMENRFPIIDILEQTPHIPENCQWAMFLRNHDELTLEMVTDEERDYMYRFFVKDAKAKINLGIRRRLAPLMENNKRKIELMNILLFSFPGTPIIYYGDEIGMGDNFYLGDRNGVRTPMQWSPDRNAGFSDTNPQKLFLPVIIDPEYHYETVNVEVQERSTSSLLWWMKRAIGLRKKYLAFGRGSLEFLNPGNPRVLAFLRKYGEERILVVVNLSRYSQAVELDLEQYSGFTPVEVFSRNKFPVIQSNQYILTLSPYDYYWFNLEIRKEDMNIRSEDIPEIHVKKTWKKLAQEDLVVLLEENIFMNYLESHNLADFQSSGFQEMEILDHVYLSDDFSCSIILFKLNYVDKPSEILLLPLKTASGKEAEFIIHSRISNAIAWLRSDNENILLYDGMYNEDFRKEMFNSFFNRKSLKGLNGEFYSAVKKTSKELIAGLISGSSEILKVISPTYSLQYSNKFFLKIYRRPEEGIQPGEEILRFLEKNSEFHNSPSLDGAVYYVREGKKPITISILNEYISHQGTAWRYFSDALGRYYDAVMSRSDNELQKEEKLDNFFVTNGKRMKSAFCETADSIILESAFLLGKRTGELHLAFASEGDQKDFESESFSILYQRSIYQAVRSSIRNTFRNLKTFKPDSKDIPGFSGLADKEEILLSFAASIVEQKIVTEKLRIHGDYHLGQILFTGKDFIITNFEGMYSSALSERRLKRSPLRDVAGMLWSFHHAAFMALNKYANLGVGVDPKLTFYAKQWWLCISRRFLSGYFEISKGKKFIPADEKITEYLLQFYLLDKTLNELNNIMNNEPEKVHLPVDILQFLLMLIENRMKSDTLETVNS